MTQPSQLLFKHDASKIELGSDWLVGIDEAGRGPLAGPVHAAGVAIHRDWFDTDEYEPIFGTVNDSKQLSAKKRDQLYGNLLSVVYPGGPIQFAVCNASVKEIDSINILEATKLAMFRVLTELEGRVWGVESGFLKTEESLFELAASEGASAVKVMVDGRPLKHFPYSHEAIVKGDGKSLCIALASIAAKVERDAWMMDCFDDNPRYAWDRNKGYGTREHCEALKKYGKTSHHRETFIGKILGKNKS